MARPRKPKKPRQAEEGSDGVQKVRADQLAVQQGVLPSRARAQAEIEVGHLYADGIKLTRPAQKLVPSTRLELKGEGPVYVSRSAHKLIHALDHFALNPRGRIGLDVGASTGGFSEVLLARGGKEVWAVDVGHGQLHPSLTTNPRLISKEGVNARYLTAEDIGAPPQAIVCDVSFISLSLILPALLPLAAEDCWFVGLIKPQFEVGRADIGKGGIVKSAEAQAGICEKIVDLIRGFDTWCVIGLTESPILGGEGNQEFLVAAKREV